MKVYVLTREPQEHGDTDVLGVFFSAEEIMERYPGEWMDGPDSVISTWEYLLSPLSGSRHCLGISERELGVPLSPVQEDFVRALLLSDPLAQDILSDVIERGDSWGR